MEILASHDFIARASLPGWRRIANALTDQAQSRKVGLQERPVDTAPHPTKPARALV